MTKHPINPDESIESTLSWNRTDTVLIGVLAAIALATRFWRIGYPDEPVFDELQFVGQSLAYLRGEQFLDVHPALPKLIIAVVVQLFGHHSWIWRAPSACLGVMLVLITFLLGREMFRSRIAATLSAAFVLFDGMFLIHSRLAMLEIFHLTFSAMSYLLLFQFLRTRDSGLARRKILWIAVFSGAALGSKLLLPGVGFLLVASFLVHGMVTKSPGGKSLTDRSVIGAVLLLISVSSLVYFSTFLPNYWLGWWGGIWALGHYYYEVLWQLGWMAEESNRFISSWWTWPFMLRAPLYWQINADGGRIASIWGGGNPVLWWGAFSALVITGVKEFQRPTTARAFLLLGYVGYLLAMALVKHPFFLYIYMAPLYLQYLMLGAVLAECWSDESLRWEHVILMLSMAPTCLLGLGTAVGTFCLLGIFAIYAVLAWRFDVGGKFVTALIVSAALVAFVYFLPVWLGTPLDPASYDARIWLRGPGVAKWM